jgi:acetyltransferase-like isoleucine patch superfamily enzyme
MVKRNVKLPEEAEAAVIAFIEEVDDRLSSAETTSEVVREVLVDLNGDRRTYDAWRNGEPVSVAERLRFQAYDPRNVTLESEYHAQKDEGKFSESKPLVWLWEQFDATPLADHIELALRFRRMLAKHLLEECGDDCRFFKDIKVGYGHNLTVGDNVVVHDDVLLDDRGKLTIGDGCSITDGAHVYSPDHDLVEQSDVSHYHTIIEGDVRLTYDVVVIAGCKIGENAMIGSRAVVTKDVPAHHVAVGMPARSVKIKPGYEDVADPIDRSVESAAEERLIERHVDLTDEEVFDEFRRGQ